MSNQIFKNFCEFWYHTKTLNDLQRQVILKTMPRQEQRRLEASYKEGGWEDLLQRNKSDQILDEIREEFNWDLLHLRLLVIKGKKLKIKKTFWQHINEKFQGIPTQHIKYIFGGYRAVPSDEDSNWYKLIPSEG